MTTLAELIAQRSALEEKIKAATESGRAEAIAKVRALMQENGLTLSDLGARAGSKAGSAAGKGGTKPGKKVAVKYRDDAGNAWSGRGLQPKWLKVALATGKKKIEDFAV